MVDQGGCDKKELEKPYSMSYFADCWQEYFLLYGLHDIANQYQVEISCITKPNCNTVYQYYRQALKQSTGETNAPLGTCIIAAYISI